MPRKSSVLGAAALALFGYTLYSSDIGVTQESSNLRNTANNEGPPRMTTPLEEEEEEYDLTKRIGT